MTIGKTCSKCQIQMETGFVPDFAYGAVFVPKWQAGPPQPARFLGRELKGQIKVDYKEGLPLTAWRCPRCTLVEFYAPAKE